VGGTADRQRLQDAFAQIQRRFARALQAHRGPDVEFLAALPVADARRCVPRPSAGSCAHAVVACSELRRETDSPRVPASPPPPPVARVVPSPRRPGGRTERAASPTPADDVAALAPLDGDSPPAAAAAAAASPVTREQRLLAALAAVDQRPHRRRRAAPAAAVSPSPSPRTRPPRAPAPAPAPAAATRVTEPTSPEVADRLAVLQERLRLAASAQREGRARATSAGSGGSGGSAADGQATGGKDAGELFAGARHGAEDLGYQTLIRTP
jgi:hypothetical protein